MGVFSAPKKPKPPPPPPPEPTPVPIEEEALKKTSNLRKRQALAQGRNSTILTSPGGLTSPAQTAYKTLLGT